MIMDCRCPNCGGEIIEWLRTPANVHCVECMMFFAVQSGELVDVTYATIFYQEVEIDD